jgi:sarcosine oxidase subunit beta
MRDPEILVIGAGIAGTSTAYHLAGLGHRVLVLDRGEIAGEASGVNAGAIESVGWGHAPDLQATLTAGSQEIFQSLQLDEGLDIEYRRSGGLQAIHNARQLDFARGRAADLTRRGFRIELLDTRAARALEPAASELLSGFLHSPERAQADPKLATRAFAEAARRRGAEIEERRAVLRVAPRGDGGWRVETSRGELVAGALVIAAGAWSRDIGAMLGLDIPVVPVRGQMWATWPLPPRIFQVISSLESALYWSREPGGGGDTPPQLTHRDTRRLTRHLYGRQTRSGEVIFGGDRQAVGFNAVPDPAGIEANRRHAAEVLPFLGGVAVGRTWGGLMPFSLDGRPLIGRLPGSDSLYMVGGMASSGFGRGPMAGKLLAELIHTGRMPTVLAEADPARCVVPRQAGAGATT